MNTKILLVAVNSSWYQSNPTLYYLREAIRDLGCQPQLRSYTTQDLMMDVLNSIYGHRPDLICFSAYIWNRNYLRMLLPDLKTLLPKAGIVIGGPEASRLANLADLVIEGPGEAAFRKLASSGFKLKDFQPGPETIALRDLPFPYRPEDQADLAGKLIYYETSRGCPFACAYCLSALDPRNERRFKSDDPDDLMRLSDELDALDALKPRTVKFVDRSFNLHPAFARALWQILISQPRSCEWHFEIYPELLTEDDIRLLESVPPGLVRFEVGVQSCNDAINLACGRHSDWPKAKKMLMALINRTEVVTHADLLCGLPEQTLEDVLKSIDELAICHPAEIQLGMLKVLPDTPMRDIASERGWLWSTHPPYTIFQTDRMSFEELRHCEILARLLNLYWNKGEFTAQWRDLLKSYPASLVLSRLRDIHTLEGYPFHSVSKGKREEVFGQLRINGTQKKGKRG